MNKLKLAMFRELEAERDKARTWATRWKRVATKWQELVGLNDDWVEKWRGDYQERVAEQNQQLQQWRATLAKRISGSEMEGVRDNEVLKAVEAERYQLKQHVTELSLARDQLEDIARTNKLDAIGYQQQVVEVQAERDQAMADCVVMRQALEATEQALKEVSGVEALAHAHGHRYTDKQVELFNRARDLRMKALSTTAGADFLDRMRKLEACQAEAASWKVKYQTLVARLTK